MAHVAISRASQTALLQPELVVLPGVNPIFHSPDPSENTEAAATDELTAMEEYAEKSKASYYYWLKAMTVFLILEMTSPNRFRLLSSQGLQPSLGVPEISYSGPEKLTNEVRAGDKLLLSCEIENANLYSVHLRQHLNMKQLLLRR